MNWLKYKFNEAWYKCVNFYHVDPVIFIVLYVVKSVIFWWLMAVILKRAVRRQWEGLALLVTLNAAVDVVPWVYVWIWGDNQPWWYQYMVYFIGGWGFVGIYLDIRRKTKNKAAAQNDASEQDNAASQADAGQDNSSSVSSSDVSEPSKAEPSETEPEQKPV